MQENKRYCVILCGGAGTRFWPYSRRDMPKQFIDFLGTGSSLLQMTVERVRPMVAPENIILVTNKDYEELVHAQLPDIPRENILCEPERRNTAPCILWAANHIAARCPDATIMSLPSDHLVVKEQNFLNAMEEGCCFVEENPALLTLGIKPTAPNTGYGYIQKGKPVPGNDTILKVKTFTEKPNREMAELFIMSGEFLWNSGILVGTADSILRAFARYQPEMAAQFAAGEKVYATPDETAFIAEVHPRAASISIDYAIMEMADNIYVKAADLGWSDLGTWRALYEASPRNGDGCVMQNCRVLTHDCRDTIFAVNGDKIVVAAGLKDYIVADNGNALLICPKADEIRMRQVVDLVASRFGEKYT